MPQPVSRNSEAHEAFLVGEIEPQIFLVGIESIRVVHEMERTLQQIGAARAANVKRYRQGPRNRIDTRL